MSSEFAHREQKLQALSLGAGWTLVTHRFFGTIGVASPVWSHQCQKSIRSDSCRISKPFSQTPKTC
jgi:hypothetical protein